MYMPFNFYTINTFPVLVIHTVYSDIQLKNNQDRDVCYTFTNLQSQWIWHSFIWFHSTPTSQHEYVTKFQVWHHHSSSTVKNGRYGTTSIFKAVVLKVGYRAPQESMTHSLSTFSPKKVRESGHSCVAWVMAVHCRVCFLLLISYDCSSYLFTQAIILLFQLRWEPS